MGFFTPQLNMEEMAADGGTSAWPSPAASSERISVSEDTSCLTNPSQTKSKDTQSPLEEPRGIWWKQADEYYYWLICIKK